MPRKVKTTAKRDRLIIFIDWLAARPLLTELTLTAITVLFGMQVLRVLIPGIYWILGSRMGLSAIQLGLIGFAIFVTGFLAGPLSWLTSNRRLIAVTVAGLGLVRLFMQVSWDEPLLNLGLAIIGTILFIIFLPACFEDARLRGSPSVSRYALGLLGGLALDTAINGAFGTYDIVWQAKLLPVLLTLIIFVFQLVLLVGTTPAIYSVSSKSTAAATGRVSWIRSFTWLAIGPFLFLELVVFQNIPRVATLTGWTLPMAFGLTLLAQLLGLVAAIFVIIKNWRMLWPWAFGAGVILTAALVFAYQPPAGLIALLFVIGQVLVSSIITMVLAGIASSTGKTRRSSLWIANGVGMILFVLFIAAYYAVYDVNLPYHNPAIELIAGGIIAACAIGAVIFEQQKMKVEPKLWSVSIFALILLVLPLAQIITWRTPTASAGQGLPLSVMTYNLNNGFNTKGKLDIDEIANVIESNRPDIVALQEVSRGWVVNGRLDMLEWLSYRLHMPYVFGPTADPFWGNAILSRYPIVAYSRENLPPPELLIQRGFTVALIDLGNDQRIKVIATQFDNVELDTEIHQQQAQTIIDFWGGLGDTILLGDFSAQPGRQEVVKLYQANLKDSTMGWKAADTYPSNYSLERIDYIWISPDLSASDVGVLSSTASDHLPVVAVIHR
ncbi:MAG: endonuclease/exonuclease/phosphatase family protein [Dehalococcoidia bacterium]